WLELTAGDHALMIDFAHTKGWHGCQLFWSVNGGPREIVPASVLFHRAKTLSIVTTMSDGRGVYRFGTVLPGRYRLRAHVPGGFAPLDDDREIVVEKDRPVANLDFHLAPFKKGQWKHYTHADGLAEDGVGSLFEAADGAMWFG